MILIYTILLFTPSRVYLEDFLHNTFYSEPSLHSKYIEIDVI